MLLLAALALAASPLVPDLPGSDATGGVWSADRGVRLTWGAGRVDLRRGGDGRLLASHDAEAVVAGALSADGRVAWVGGRSLWRWDLATNGWVEVTGAPAIADLVHLELSPEGDRLLRMAGRSYSDSGLIEILDTDGRVIASIPVEKAASGWHHAAVFDPRPGARRLLVAAGSKVLAVDTGTGEVQTLAQPRGGASTLAWQPGATAIAVAGHDARARTLEVNNGALLATSPRCRFLGESAGRQGWMDLAWNDDGTEVAGVCEVAGGARVLRWAPSGLSEPAMPVGLANGVAWAGDQLLAVDRGGRLHRVVGGELADVGDLVPGGAAGGPTSVSIAARGATTARGTWSLSESPGWTVWRTAEEERPLDLAHLSLGERRPASETPRFDPVAQAFTLGAPLGAFPAGARLPLPGATEARIERGWSSSLVAVDGLIVASVSWRATAGATRGVVAWSRQGVAWTHPSGGDRASFEVVGDRVLVDGGGTVRILELAKGTPIAAVRSGELAGRRGWTYGAGTVVNLEGTELWVVTGPDKGIYDLRTGRRTGTPPDGAALPPHQGRVVYADRDGGCVGPDRGHCVPLAGLPETHGVVAYRWRLDGAALLGLDMYHTRSYAWTPTGEPLAFASGGGVEIQGGIYAQAEGDVLRLSRAQDGAALRVAQVRSGRLVAWSDEGVVQAVEEDVAVREGAMVRAPTQAERAWLREDLVSAFLSGAPLPGAPR